MCLVRGILAGIPDVEGGVYYTVGVEGVITWMYLVENSLNILYSILKLNSGSIFIVVEPT